MKIQVCHVCPNVQPEEQLQVYVFCHLEVLSIYFEKHKVTKNSIEKALLHAEKRYIYKQLIVLLELFIVYFVSRRILDYVCIIAFHQQKPIQKQMKKNNFTLSPIIKICGLTSLEQALSCVELGANWLGFNCWDKSSRYITFEKAMEIVAGLPQSVTTVGVFVNESTKSIERIMRKTGMNVAQLHGDETPKSCKQITVPWFKAFRVSPEFRPKQIQDFGCNTFLLDAYSEHYGGSGEKINLELASTVTGMGKLILAGGLSPDNVVDAINKVHPWGVDVCSGVESEPGIKDLLKVKEFINNIRNEV